MGKELVMHLTMAGFFEKAPKILFSNNEKHSCKTRRLSRFKNRVGKEPESPLSSQGKP
jgi:hypothetical protein